MNRNDCDIVRDLMPLSVDGVCSESSQRILDAHVAQCQTCRSLFTRMKAGMPTIQAKPTDEAQALKKGLRYLGKRFKALWITLAALVCAFALLLVAAGVNQVLQNYSTGAPLDMYTVSIYSNDALVSMGLAANFNGQEVYNGFQREEYYMKPSDSNEDSVILTYTVHWFPYRHQEVDDTWNDIFVSGNVEFKAHGVNSSMVQNGAVRPVITGWSSNARFTTMLETHQLCVDNARLYMIDGWDSVQTTTGRTLMIPHLGTPVYEVRLSDGKETRTVYAAWKNDEIPNVSADRFDKNGLPMSGVIGPSDLEKYADFINK
jgi:hypothetical protein